MLQVLVDISLKSFVVAKRHGAMQKFEKKKKKEREKNGHKDVRSI